MRKVMFALAVVGMISFCSCKSNQPVETVEATETEVVTEVPAEEMPVEEVAATAETPAETPVQ